MSDRYEEQELAIRKTWWTEFVKDGFVAAILRTAAANAREAAPLPPPVCTGTGAVIDPRHFLSGVTVRCPICGSEAPVVHWPNGSVIEAHAYRPPEASGNAREAQAPDEKPMLDLDGPMFGEEPPPFPRPPQDDAEREAVAGRSIRAGHCMATQTVGWLCTRLPGHAGDHVAAQSKDGAVSIVARWPQSAPDEKPEAQPATAHDEKPATAPDPAVTEEELDDAATAIDLLRLGVIDTVRRHRLADEVRSVIERLARLR